MIRKFKLDVFSDEAGYNVKLTEYGKGTPPPFYFKFRNRRDNKRPEATAIKIHGNDYVLRDHIRRNWRNIFNLDDGPPFVSYSSGKTDGHKIRHTFAIAFGDGTCLLIFLWIHGIEFDDVEVKLNKKQKGYRGCAVIEQEVSANV